ncbi:MAG: hypothetical protein JNJ54_27940 [Myxococcaceae bacterium]|nr:hypothetical protein [Myxococcaceae bacterium]
MSSFRNVGIVAVLLAAIAVGGVLFSVKPARPAEASVSSEVLDRLVMDYAFQVMRQETKQAVAKCGTDLGGQEADVTVVVSVTDATLHLSKVRLTQNAWTQERLGCVASVFEGYSRRPTDDGVKAKFPENSEYELDARLYFERPTLQYSE